MATDAKTGQPIFHGATRGGLRNVGSYQVSGHPFITGSIINANEQHTIEFPYVTKKVTVGKPSRRSAAGHLYFFRFTRRFYGV